MITNARKQAGIINPDTGDYFELDLYLPDKKLALEYQVPAFPSSSSSLLSLIAHLLALSGSSSLYECVQTCKFTEREGSA